MNKRKKIKLFQQHFAYIDEEFLYEFYHKTHIINISSFIKRYAFKDFGIMLDNIDDISYLEEQLNNYFYKDKTEWLREKMRLAIQDSK